MQKRIQTEILLTAVQTFMNKENTPIEFMFSDRQYARTLYIYHKY
jgi:hypothetical protein